MNKLEICITELDKEIDGGIALGCKSVAKLELPYSMCVEFFKATLEGLEHINENMFMDALEEYLKEK